MGKVEEPMKFYARVGKIVGALAPLGVTKSDAGVDRKKNIASNLRTSAFPLRRPRMWDRL